MEVPFDPRRNFVSLQEIMDHSPSKRDGIEWQLEAGLRTLCATFIRKLGLALKLHPKVTATASFFCHKFFLLRSFARNDPQTIATACMFLASKSEDAPRLLEDVVIISYSLIHRGDPAALQLKKPKEGIFTTRCRLILRAEALVIATLDFNFEILHPHVVIKDEVKNLDIESLERKNALAQVAWNFANDGLLTTLCLQYSAQQIAGGYIFLGLKYLKLKLQDGSVSFWQNTFDVTTHQLGEICSQLLSVYNTLGRQRELRGNAGDGGGARAAAEAPAANEARACEPNPSSSKGKEKVEGSVTPTAAHALLLLGETYEHSTHLQKNDMRTLADIDHFSA